MHVHALHKACFEHDGLDTPRHPPTSLPTHPPGGGGPEARPGGVGSLLRLDWARAGVRPPGFLSSSTASAAPASTSLLKLRHCPALRLVDPGAALWDNRGLS